MAVVSQISNSLLIWLKDLSRKLEHRMNTLEYQQAWYLYLPEN